MSDVSFEFLGVTRLISVNFRIFSFTHQFKFITRSTSIYLQSTILIHPLSLSLHTLVQVTIPSHTNTVMASIWAVLFLPENTHCPHDSQSEIYKMQIMILCVPCLNPVNDFYMTDNALHVLC